MWSVEVSIQTPIAIFSSQDNNWTIGRNFYLSQFYCQPQASQHAQCGACYCATHITSPDSHFQFSQQNKIRFFRFICKSVCPGTSEADRVTEWTFLSTWQLPKWQIDQIFSSVSKTKIFPGLSRAHFLCLNAKIAKRTFAFKSPFHFLKDARWCTAAKS